MSEKEARGQVKAVADALERAVNDYQDQYGHVRMRAFMDRKLMISEPTPWRVRVTCYPLKDTP